MPESKLSFLWETLPNEFTAQCQFGAARGSSAVQNFQCSADKFVCRFGVMQLQDFWSMQCAQRIDI